MALLMSIAMVVCLAPGVFAAGSGMSFNDFYDGSNAGDKCSLTITAGDKLPSKGKLAVKLYKVADARVEMGYVTYSHTDLFDYDTDRTEYLSDKAAEDGEFYNKWVGNVDLSSAYDSEWATRANTLAGYTVKEGFYDLAAGDGIGWSDEIDLASADRMISFGGLTRGLYLVVPEKIYSGSTEYTCSPILICLPNKSTGQGADVAWRPDEKIVLDKVKTYSDGGGGSDTKESVSVVKKWEDEGQEADRPASVTVELLRDGKLYDTKKLSKENSWRYTWTGLARGNVWTVNEVTAESVSDKYTVTTDKNSAGNKTDYVITNTHTTDIPEEEPPLAPGPGPEGGDSPGSDVPPTDIPDSDVPLNPAIPDTSAPSGDSASRLPQTGQLWWPVPILAVAGILTFSVGWARSRKEEADDEV